MTTPTTPPDAADRAAERIMTVWGYTPGGAKEHARVSTIIREEHATREGVKQRQQVAELAEALRDVLMMCSGYLRQQDARLLEDARAVLSRHTVRTTKATKGAM